MEEEIKELENKEKYDLIELLELAISSLFASVGGEELYKAIENSSFVVLI